MEKKPNDKKLTRKEKRKERRQKKEVSRLKRISRFRPFKNLLWWLTGVITPIILLVIAIGAGTFLIPISTYIKWAGGNPEDYVNEEISDKSVYGSIANISDYTMEDVPAIKLLVEALSDALSGIQINGTPLFDINRDKLEGLKDNKLVGDFAGFFTEYTSCLSVVATISCLGIDFGALGQLSSMNTFEEVKEDEQLNLYLSDGTPVEVPQLYYFDANQLVSMAIILDPPVAQPQTADPNDPDSNDPVDPEPSNPVDPEPSDPVEPDNPEEPAEEPTEPAGDYRRLFNNDGTLVSDLSTLTPEQLDELVIYYPALNSVPMVDFMAVFGPRIKTTSVNSLVGAFTGSTGDGLLDKILGDKTIASLGGLTTSDIYLVDFLDPPSEEMPTDPEAEDYQEKLNAYNKNRDIYDILMGATGKQTYAEISLADLSNMDINAVSLSVILDAPTTDTILEKPTDESAPDYEEQLKAYTESYNGYHQNRKLYDILLDAAGIEFVSYETYNELTIEHLRSINIDNVKLSSVLEAPAEEMPTDPEAPDYQEKLDAGTFMIY